MMEAFFRFFLLGKRVSRFRCQNVVFTTFICCLSVLSKEFHGYFVSHFQEFRCQVFSCPVFLFVRGLFHYI